MINAKKRKLGLIISTILSTQVAYALPQGSQVVQGTAAFSSPNASTLNITNSNNAVINWQQFNIGAGQTTNFIQPNSASSVLNRVISNNPSQILGNLNSNGQVYLINQHGILVGDGARINTNGFFASTLNITNEDFLNGNLKFSEGGLGDIDNKGYIHAGENGNVVLVAPNIENGGVIDVENGNIILAAGKSITITSLDNTSVEFHVQGSDNKVTNLGSVIARNGAVNLFAGSLVHSGSIRATGLVRDENGIVRLVALDKTEVSGAIDVSGDLGGKVEVLGDEVVINSGANIDASGRRGGGEILIGGDQQGLNLSIKNAKSTTIDENAVVTANAVENGDGGRIIVFASNDVHVHEVITAKGGSTSGDGGFIETSGLQELDITATPDASAAVGEGGEWLIDPNNITIQSSGSDTNISSSGYGAFDSNADAAILTTNTIETALNAGTSVIISTGATGSEQGNININDDIVLSASILGNLTLNAHQNVNVNADIDAGGVGQFDLTLNANIGANGGIVSFDNATINLGGGDLTLTGSGIAINNAVNFSGPRGQINLSAPLTINPLANFTVSGPSLFSTPTVINNTSGITNNGTFTVDAGCDDGCGQVIVDGVFDNNGLIDFTGGELRVDGTLNLNSGTSFNVQNPRSSGFGGDLNINNGVLNVNVASTLDLDLNLVLTGGTINNFHLLSLSHYVNLNGGTVNFTDDIFGLYLDENGVNPRIGISTDSPLTFNGSATGNYFLYTGTVDWYAYGTNNNIILNNVDLRLLGDFNTSASQAMNINGTNGRLSLLGSSILSQQSDQLLTINVPVIANGKIELTDNSGQLSIPGGLTLANGGSLEGVGTYIGNVVVESGGRVSPGVSGFYNDNTGILNITGNILFEAGSILQIDIDDDAVNYDQLMVSGATTVNGGDAYFFWDTLSSSNPDLFTFGFNPIQSASLSGVALTFHDLPAYSGSSLSVSGSNVQFIGGSPTGTPIRYWTGSGNSDNWSDAFNWSAISTPYVPTAGELVVVEADLVEVDVATSQLGFAQIDANVVINSAGDLGTSGDLFTLQNLDIDANSSLISGTGAWMNFGDVYFNHAGFNLSKNVVNYGGLTLADFTVSTSDFMVSSASFINNGSFLAYSNNVGMNFDFSSSTSGLVNNGTALFLVNGAQTTFKGDLFNQGIVNFASPQLSQSHLVFEDSFNNSGQVNFTDTVLQFDSSSIFALYNGSAFSGQSEFIINNGASLQIQTSTTFGTDQKLTLNGGTVYLVQDLDIAGIFDWNEGVVGGIGSTFTTLSGSTVNMASGFGNNVLNVIDMSIQGTLNISSNGTNLLANENKFTITGSNNNLEILNSASLNGGGLIYIDQNSSIDVANATQINPKLLVTGTANFAGSAGLSLLALESGFNATVNVDVNGIGSVGDTLLIQDLIWETGSIIGSNSTTAKIVTTGTSILTSGNLTDVDWTNQGVLNWQGTVAETFSLSNASFTNDVNGIINVTGTPVIAVKQANTQNTKLKSITGSTGSLINNGILNLINTDLDLGGMSLVLGSSTSVLNGSGTLTADVINSDGSVTIGNPNVLSNPGALVIDGDYTQGANASLKIRIVDPINGNFTFDTFTVNGTANLDGALQIAYYSNQVLSITESFNPFSFANRNGVFSTLIDSNGTIINADFSNGSFTILGTASSSNPNVLPLQDILQSQDEFKKILEVLKDDDLNETLAFIKVATAERNEEKEKEKKKEKVYRLVCK